MNHERKDTTHVVTENLPTREVADTITDKSVCTCGHQRRAHYSKTAVKSCVQCSCDRFTLSPERTP